MEPHQDPLLTFGAGRDVWNRRLEIDADEFHPGPRHSGSNLNAMAQRIV